MLLARMSKIAPNKHFFNIYEILDQILICSCIGNLPYVKKQRTHFVIYRQGKNYLPSAYLGKQMNIIIKPQNCKYLP